MLMKEGLNQAAIRHLSQVFNRIWPEFDQQGFLFLALQDLEQRELKQRLNQIIHALQHTLPVSFPDAVPVLEGFSRAWQVADPDSPLRGFPAWAVTDYVAVAGIESPEYALPVLKKLTPLFSAEFAIRPFLIRYPELTLNYLQSWLKDSDEHVRRLVSEGTRPRLPWGQQLKAFIQDPSPCLPLLHHLACDKSEYVRRSVANHLNDIAKDHPQLVISHCHIIREASVMRQQVHYPASKEPEPEIDWVIRHATRTLVKQGMAEVFPLLGYDDNPQLSVELQLSQNRIRLGDTLEFSVQLTPEQKGKQKLVLDYAIHHVKANGSLSAKVFKLKNLALEQASTINKQHRIKPISTRRYYSGQHKLEILINGQSVAEAGFWLDVTT